MLRSRLRVAGFTPCGNINSLSRGNNNLQAFRNITGGIETLRMAEDYLQVAGIVDGKSLANIITNKNTELLIADCYHVEIYRRGQALQNNYLPPVFVGELIKEQIFLNDQNIFYKLRHAEKLIAGVATFTVSAVEKDLLRAEISLSSGRLQTVFARMRSQ